MLAGLSVLWARCRRIFPPSGRGYELFNTGGVLILVGLFAYILADPPVTTATALRAPLEVLTEPQVGWLVSGAGVLACLLSYATHPACARLSDDQVKCVVRIGYYAAQGAPLILAGWFAVGYFTTDTDTRALAQTAIYGFTYRAAYRASTREWLRRDFSPDEVCRCCGGGHG